MLSGKTGSICNLIILCMNGVCMHMCSFMFMNVYVCVCIPVLMTKSKFKLFIANVRCFMIVCCDKNISDTLRERRFCYASQQELILCLEIT